jgi:hypothetical protein
MGWLANLHRTPVIGAILGPIVNGLLKAQKQKLEAEGSHEAKVSRTGVCAKCPSSSARRSCARRSLVAEQGNWMTRWVRPMWSLPFVAWTWKVVIWDKMLGWGSTPELTGITANLCLLVAGAYFIGRSGEKIANTLSKK